MVTSNFEQLLFDFVADHQAVIHVGSLLELTLPHKSVFAIIFPAHLGIGVMRWPSNPTDILFLIEATPSLSLCSGKKLHTVIVDEDVGRSALHLVRRHRGLQGQHSRHDDSSQSFFIDWHLNGDVWEGITVFNTRWCLPRVEFGVLLQLIDWAYDLSNVGDDNLHEKQRNEYLSWNGDEECEASVISIDRDLLC